MQNPKTQTGTEVKPVGDVKEPVFFRLPECNVMMSESGPDKTGRPRDGSIGLKSGDSWLWLSYTSMRKLIDLMMENRERFNHQLKLEREQIAVKDL